MEQKIIFREMLSEILQMADEKGNVLTIDEINAFFANASLNQEQMKLIYDYLLGQKIKITDYQAASPVGEEKTEDSHREDSNREVSQTEDVQTQDSSEVFHSEALDIYLKEVQEITKIEGKEEYRLFELAVDGDDEARAQLVELYLPYICELASEYEGGEFPVEDLIQEGNLGLFMAVSSLQKRDSLAAYQIQLMNGISEYMQDALQQQKDEKEMSDGMVRRVNRLNEAIVSMEEELEHKISVDELSAYLEMPAQEIRSILKMAGDEIEIDDSEENLQ